MYNVLYFIDLFPLLACNNGLVTTKLTMKHACECVSYLTVASLAGYIYVFITNYRYSVVKNWFMFVNCVTCTCIIMEFRVFFN